MNIQQYIHQHFSENEDKIALLSKVEQLTYGELYVLGKKIASLFDSYKNSKTIAFCLVNSPALIQCYLGCWLSGKNAFPLNNRFKSTEMITILNDYPADLLIINTSKLDDKLERYLKRKGIKFLFIDDANYQIGNFWERLIQFKPFSPAPAFKQNAYTIFLTSGTTGRYKAVLHKNSKIAEYALKQCSSLNYYKTDKLLVCLSLNHAFSFSYQLLPAISLGLSMVLMDKFNASEALSFIKYDHITSISLLPSMSYLLAKEAQRTQAKFKHNLRLCLVAGDALPSSMYNAFNKSFNIDLIEGLGMTELLGFTINSISNNKNGSAGKALLGVNIKICDKNNKDLPRNRIGEIQVQSDEMFEGYWLNQELGKQAFNKGWFKTGDIGKIDGNGFLWFYGRKKQIIISGGSNIAPLQVESIIYQYPDVLEAAVVGKHDKILIEQVWAYVVLIKDSSLTEKSLQKFITERLADYKVPKKIIFLDSLPKNISGKIDRLKLKDMAKECEYI